MHCSSACWISWVPVSAGMLCRNKRRTMQPAQLLQVSHNTLHQHQNQPAQ